MTAIVTREDRQFQMWAYSVSMARLLLRSTKSDTFATRVDVLFQNVKAMKVPTSLDGLVVAKADPEQAAIIAEETGLLPDRETIIFSVSGPAYDGYIVAGVCVSAEDNGEYYDPSELWPEH